MNLLYEHMTKDIVDASITISPVGESVASGANGEVSFSDLGYGSYLLVI